MKAPTISIVIPTRERCNVLQSSLRTAVSQDYDRLEILVSDNCSTDDTEGVVRSLRDPRVRYLNPGRRLSMSHNWEFALSHVADGWVTVIGDDDGLLPGSVAAVAEIIRSTDVRAIRSSVCSYAWPAALGTEFGQLRVPMRTGHETRDSRTWLAKVLNGEADYPQLPMLYNGGYVDMSVLQEIKSRTGSMYLSRIPDVYSAVSIASTVPSYLYRREPLAINGASQHSTGTAIFSQSEGQQSPAVTFASEANIPFHHDMTAVGGEGCPTSLQALVYESYLQSGQLRPGASPVIHAEQLELVLASAGRHAADLTKWGARFADRHGLDFQAIVAKADRRRRRMRLKATFQEAMMELNTRWVGSADIPIKDVYEASLVAAAITASGNQRWQGMRRLLARAVQKIGNP